MRRVAYIRQAMRFAAIALVALPGCGFARVQRHVFLAVTVPNEESVTRSPQWEGAALILNV